ncbi:hypothetical protein [Marinirhabdus gelatinilytica]|uniref:Uncharacterized protein n=1 Tax=Marinirhabdus gelatinilytica TaxID=1703343 RepID=A0A370QJK8_9FLAO|nr:hypothetical protein [Marinirhabdus gelatinilytica]RDK88519.1 hypothetical protein C8D94_101393 [Marinirhabdus gelatinilytica]
MVLKNVLQEIESEYAVESIILSDGTPVWPLLRQAIYFKIQQKKVQYSNKLRTRNKKQLLKNFFYGFPHVFQLKKFQFIFFNNTDKRVLINNTYFDIFQDAWADKVGQRKSFFIEWAKQAHLPKDRVHSENVTSDLPFKLVVGIVSKFKTISIKNEHLLKEILTQQGISFDYSKELKSKLAEISVFSRLFKIMEPKAIFVLSSFTKIGVVRAAKQLAIPVFEPQHGFIGDTHPFYHALKKFPDFYPDVLLSFGASEKIINKRTLVFSSENIIPTGSLQLDLVQERALPDKLKELKAKYRLLFCVTLQAIKDKEILSWVEGQAKSNKDWLFIVKPKQPNFTLSLYTSTANVITLSEISTYDVLKASDYNITIFSTTVIEGIFLKAKPLLYNVDDLPKKYFDLSTSTIALINNGEPITEKHLDKKGNFTTPYFVSGYFKNVESASLCF